MTRRFREQIPQILARVDWDRFTSVVDIGGGQGTLLAAILTDHPRVRGQLIDLAPTAARAWSTFAAAGLHGRAEALSGNFFDPLPPGADAYLLCDILHDWDDEHAHAILARCAEAAGSHSRILIIEAVSGRHATTDTDLAMLVFYGGRERSIDELRDLADHHGLRLDTTTDISPYRSMLEFTLPPRTR